MYNNLPQRWQQAFSNVLAETPVLIHSSVHKSLLPQESIKTIYDSFKERNHRCVVNMHRKNRMCVKTLSSGQKYQCLVDRVELNITRFKTTDVKVFLTIFA